MALHIYAVNKKGVSCRKQGVSWTKIAFLFKCSNSLVFYYIWFRKPNSRVQRRSEQYLEACFVLFLCTEGACAEAKIWRKKKLHKALRSVQFLTSFTSFYFEILSYLACGEKITRLASKNSVKLDEKSVSDF